MARTHGASGTGIQFPDGQLLDREGKPVPTPVPVPVMVVGDVVEAPPTELPGELQAEPPVITRYICNEKTISRGLDAYSLMHLLSLAMGGGLEISLSPEDFVKQIPDVKIHFRPVMGGS